MSLTFRAATPSHAIVRSDEDAKEQVIVSDDIIVSRFFTNLPPVFDHIYYILAKKKVN